MEIFMLKRRWLLAIPLSVCAFFIANVPLKPALWPVSVAAIIFFAAPVIISVIKWIGKKQGVILLGGLGLYAVIFESIAIITGWPYGEFNYGNLLGPLILGLAPWPLIVAWTPLILGVYALIKTTGAIKIILAAMMLVAIDLVLDPAAVSLGFWQWDQPGPYYGIPVINFVGWFISGGIAAAGLEYFRRRQAWPAPPKTFVVNIWLILVFWTAVNVWTGLIIPAVIGLSMVLYINHTYLKASLVYND